MAKETLKQNLLDFSEPWDFSDVVLSVEGSSFHVHRNVLMRWSPVFARMFKADFREKSSRKVDLPRKKANDIREMLLVLYSTQPAKQINEDNCLLLLELAREYMMTELSEECENYLINSLGCYGPRHHPCHPSQLCLDLLMTAQDYKLERLQESCVAKAQSISLWELKNHENYEKIDLSNYRKIAEGKIRELEQELVSKEQTANQFKSSSERGKQSYEYEKRQLKSQNQQIKSRASKALRMFENIVYILEFIAPGKNPRGSGSLHVSDYDRDRVRDKLARIKHSDGELNKLYDPLNDLYTELKSLQS